jgi:hypothetical protein
VPFVSNWLIIKGTSTNAVSEIFIA